jgi:hypothetical protein
MLTKRINKLALGGRGLEVILGQRRSKAALQKQILPLHGMNHKRPEVQ